MATQVKDEKGKSDKNFFIFVDAEKFVPTATAMTPNQIIDDATELDPASHYLLRTNRGLESFKDKGDVPITLEKADRFQVVSVGPTPVS